MKRNVKHSRSLCTGVVVLAGLVVLTWKQAGAETKQIENRPAKSQNPPIPGMAQIAPAQPAAKPALGKLEIERPTEQLLAKPSNLSTVPAVETFVNPKVEPGKIHWHDSFATACTASKTSGKPVLLFQMMGNLNQRFC
jgi:hypothetical protein